MAAIRLKRGTLANVSAAASADGLVEGEPYYITDRKTFAVGTGVDDYIEYPRIVVSATEPAGAPDGTIWIDIA